jgi:hypothetical protein
LESLAWVLRLHSQHKKEGVNMATKTRRRAPARRSATIAKYERALVSARRTGANLRMRVKQERFIGGVASGTGGVSGYLVGEIMESRMTMLGRWDARIVVGSGALVTGVGIGMLGRGRVYWLTGFLVWFGLGVLASLASSPILARMGQATFQLEPGADPAMLANNDVDFDLEGVEVEQVEAA